jgi:predicted permease
MIRWLRRLARRRSIEASIQTEMEFHQQARAADLMAHEGMSAAAARRQASLEFGSISNYREEARQALGFRPLDELRADLRFAWRSLSKSPMFTVSALVILGLAIGVNAAFFSLYNHYVLAPLPIRGAERHVDLVPRDAQARRVSAWTTDEVDVLRTAAPKELEGVYTVSGLLQVLLLEPQQRHTMVMAVSESFFPLLGGHPAQGRGFTERDQDQAIAVLSDSGRRRLFPGDAAPIGQTVRLRATTFTIVGVMPEAFTGIEAAVPDFWVHASMRHTLREDLGTRHGVSALLRPGVRPERAAAVLSAAARRLPRASNDIVEQVEVEAHSSYLSANDEETSVMGPALFATFFLVLLIASANLANLFLARMAARRPEIVTRFSIGAGRARIVRQLLTEAALLGLAAAAVGVTLAMLAVAHLQQWLLSIATQAGAAITPLRFDWRLFAFAAVLGVAAGALFGVLPALDAVDLVRKRRNRLKSWLLAGQVAASLVLLILAGLLVRNVQRLSSVQAGFDLEHTFALQMHPPTAPVVEHLRTQPGVQGVSVVSRAPLMGQVGRYDARIGDLLTRASTMHVDDHYFATTGVAVRSGRAFTATEAASRARVAIVSAGTARSLWPDRSALGQTFTIAAGDDGEPAWHGTFEVIGVAADVINGFIFQGPEAVMVYLPGAVGQEGMGWGLIRLADGQAASLEAIRQACRRVPDSPGCSLRSLGDVASMQRFPFRAGAAVAGGLGVLALLLTAVGLYAVVSYSIERRRREIGVLVAIGAQRRHVLARILDEPARCLAWGIGLGLPCCFLLSYLAAATPLNVQTFDVSAYVGVSVLLASIAVLACVLPIRRALQIEPMEALRQD